MDNLPIILGVVVIAAVLVYFLFFRKKAELPEKATPGAPAELRPAKEAKAKAKEAEAEEARPAKEAPVSAKKGTPLAPESLPSADVLPESVEMPGLVEAPLVPPPVVSKKDVAGL